MGVEFVSHANEVLGELERKSRAALEAVGDKCASEAKNTYTRFSRVDQDVMRGGTNHLVQGDTVYIGTNATYAIYHEVGTGIYVQGGRKTPWAYQDAEGQWHRTRGVSPTHAIRDCVAQHINTIKKIIKTYLESG